MEFSQVIIDTYNKLSENLRRCINENEQYYSDSKFYLDIILDLENNLYRLVMS